MTGVVRFNGLSGAWTVDGIQYGNNWVCRLQIGGLDCVRCSCLDNVPGCTHWCERIVTNGDWTNWRKRSSKGKQYIFAKCSGHFESHTPPPQAPPPQDEAGTPPPQNSRNGAGAPPPSEPRYAFGRNSSNLDIGLKLGFKVGDSFTLHELKMSYRKFTLLKHPDKTGVDDEDFRRFMGKFQDFFRMMSQKDAARRNQT